MDGPGPRARSPRTLRRPTARTGPVDERLAEEVMADLATRRFRAAAERLSAANALPELVDTLRRCYHRMVEADRLGATLRELVDAVDREIDMVCTRLGGQIEYGAVEEPKPSGAHQLQIFGFGRFEVIADGDPVEQWTSGPGQSVLKVLATRFGGPMHREELMAALWPDASHERARNCLNVAIHGLRRSLRSVTTRTVVVYAEDSYLISDRVSTWFDATQFEEHSRAADQHRDRGLREAAAVECAKAVALYRGDLFAGEHGIALIDQARRASRRRYQQILDDLAAHTLEAGDLSACVQWSEKLLAVEPWHEGAHERLMRAHARRGQSHLAARQFLTCARILRSELGAMPSRRIIEVYERVKRHQPV